MKGRMIAVSAVAVGILRAASAHADGAAPLPGADVPVQSEAPPTQPPPGANGAQDTQRESPRWPPPPPDDPSRDGVPGTESPSSLPPEGEAAPSSLPPEAAAPAPPSSMPPEPAAPPSPSMAPEAAAPPPPSVAAGEWVYSEPNGWMWVPASAAAVSVGGAPYAYVYGPTSGWTWIASPWGWGPFVDVRFPRVWGGYRYIARPAAPRAAVFGERRWPGYGSPRVVVSPRPFAGVGGFRARVLPHGGFAPAVRAPFYGRLAPGHLGGFRGGGPAFGHFGGRR